MTHRATIHALHSHTLSAVADSLEGSAPAIERALMRVLQHLVEPALAQALVPAKLRVTARVGQDFYFFDPLEIDYFWTSDKYVCFRHNGKEHVLDETLNSLETRLGTHHFLRVHRGALVNMNRVRCLRREVRGGTLVLESGCEVPIARRAMPEVYKALDIAMPSPTTPPPPGAEVRKLRAPAMTYESSVPRGRAS